LARDILTIQRNQSDMQRTDFHCKNLAIINGMEWLTRTQNKTHGNIPGLDTTCKAFKELQASVCDCVPKEQWEESWKLRAEEFLRLHDPKYLDARGRFKNKKMWKSYRGKRPQLMFDMVTSHSAKVVKTISGPKPWGRLPSQSAQDMLDGKVPESVKKLFPGIDGKLQIAANNTNNTSPLGKTRHEAWQAEMMKEEQANGSRAPFSTNSVSGSLKAKGAGVTTTADL